ncbi:hypothetical protein AgCh_033937 [Apium graveolens]
MVVLCQKIKRCAVVCGYFRLRLIRVRNGTKTAYGTLHVAIYEVYHHRVGLTGGLSGKVQMRQVGSTLALFPECQAAVELPPSVFPSFSYFLHEMALLWGYMVRRGRVKQLANLKRRPDRPHFRLPDNSSSDSSPEPDNMPPRYQPVVEELPTFLLNPRKDSGPGGREPYNGARMDWLFYNALGTGYVPAPRHPDLSEYTFQQIDDLVKVVFHFGDDMERRWPEPHERSSESNSEHFDFPGNPLDTERIEYKIDKRNRIKLPIHERIGNVPQFPVGVDAIVAELALNSVKWVSWFLACCHVKKYLPTFKLFHYLFKIKKSTLPPLFEFTFNINGCGFPADAKSAPVFMLNSLRGWHQEFIFVRGGDLEFIPVYKTALKNNRFPTEKLGGDALKKIYDFVVALGAQWTRDSFLYNQTLYNVGCLLLLNPFHHAMSQQFKDLAGRFKKIGGVVQLDSRKKKAGVGSGSQAWDAGSSGNSVRRSVPVVTTPIVPELEEVEVLELDEEEVGALNPRKRKAMEEAAGSSGTPQRRKVSDSGPTEEESQKLVEEDALKSLLARMTLDDHRNEMFENYATPADFECYAKDDLDTFLDHLVWDVSEANARINGCSTILHNYRIREAKNKAAVKELSKEKETFTKYREVKERESREHKKAVAEAVKAQEAIEQVVGSLRAEVENLKKELAARPRAEEVLEFFRGTPAYYEELNNKIFEKVNICWDIASAYLTENPSGDMDGFI